jgi:hypothetical protein
VEKRGIATLEELVGDEVTLPDLIASFLGVLELVKIRKLLVEDGDSPSDNALLSSNTRFILNTDSSTVGESEYDIDELTGGNI